MRYDLIVTGDLMFLSPVVRSDGSPLQTIWREFAGAHHVFCNLEAVFTTETSHPDKLVCMKSDPALAPEIRRAGVSVVTVANNHANDYGWPGMRQSLDALDAAAVPHVGAGPDIDAALRPVMLEAQGRTVAFLGLSSTSAGHFGAGPGQPGLAGIRIAQSYVVDTVTIDEQPGCVPFVETVALKEDVERACAAVADAKRRADLVIVGIHWGVSFGWLPLNQSELCTYEQPLGHALVDAGADAIVGHHPHILHGIEWYRKRPIFYSVGNFLFHRHSNPRGRGSYPPYISGPRIPGRAEATRHGCYVRMSWDGGPNPSRVELVPVWLDERGEPEPPARERAELSLGTVEFLSQKFGTPLRRTADGIAIAL